jgi:chaperonin GroES
MMSTETKLRPLADRVVVEVVDESEQTVGGIYIPDSAKEKPQKAIVRFVGPGRTEDGKLIAMTVNVGDTILFAKYAGTDVKLQGHEYKILSEKDILCILEG